MKIAGNAATVFIMCAVLGGSCALALGGSASSAARDLMFAKDNAESGRWDDFVDSMKKADTDMQGLSDAEKAPLQQQIDEIKSIVTKSVEQDVNKRLDRAAQAGRGEDKLDTDRAAMRLDSDEAKGYADPAVLRKLRARIAELIGAPAPTPTPDNPKPAVPPTVPPGAMSDEVQAAVSHMRTAHAMFDQGETKMAESLVHQSVGLVESAPEAQKAAILADAAALNKQIDEADLKAQRAEEARRVDEQVHRFVGTAETSIQTGLVSNSEWIDKSRDLLASHDVQTNMEPAKIKDYQSQLDAISAKLKAHNIEVSVERATPILKELQDRVATDPFKGANDITASSTYDELKTLVHRARHEFNGVPKDDPAIKPVLDQIDAADAKIEAASGKWAVKQVEDTFASSWKFSSQDFAGWESDSIISARESHRHVPGFDKTIRAIRGTLYWLNDRDTRQTAAKYKEDAVIASTLEAANKTLEGASAKLNDAYNSVVAQAEREPMPSRESDREEVDQLARDAARWFDGTRYKDPNVARAVALSNLWKAQVARIQKEMQETLNRLAAEASAAWPAIEAKAAPERGFDPSQAGDWKGKVIEIKGYYNRSGWDFDGAYDWAADIKGHPVAGTYDDRVKAAFAEGARHTQFGIDDHVGWDVIAIVEDKGTIKRRTHTDWRDKLTGELIMKTETYEPEPCITIKIIGLHAGPVAVGPK
jgi:hypothetical protein